MANIYGNVYANTLYGTAYADNIYSYEGNDYVDAGSGNDYVDGWYGNDTIYGYYGNDTLYGYYGNDYLYGEYGNDYLYGEGDSDYLSGGANSDYLNGGSGNDTLVGSWGGYNTYEYDTLVGGAGADKFVLGDSYGSYYTGGGYAIITDFYWGQGDKIQVKSGGIATSFQNWSGSSALDTAIYKNGDLIGVVQDTTNVIASADFIYV